MTPQETFTTLIELKLSKIEERIQNDATTDWQETYSKRDFRAGELEELADKYVFQSLMQELYFQSSKNINK